jgi:protein-disulfide isomerase
VEPQFEGDVQLIYRHWPLDYHRSAYAAARAAECAGKQDLYEPYHNMLFANPRRLGDWEELAALAHIPDMVAFGACARDTEPVPAVDRDVAAAMALGARGTPTVIVDGLYLGMPPDSADLADLFTTILRKLPEKQR